MKIRRILHHQLTHKAVRIIAIGFLVVFIADILEAHRILTNMDKGTEFILGSFVDHALFGE